ncbi:AraC family transcriptional regulator [Hymenobacter oligotrophus]|uniref:AraC family transcriptional regulator n=1 Tax=Hymenobacter oligotrophus TaxID=2319843 RepID=A0A3B7R9S7_9BACT|nr:AraC family transcriptional regulator [Hymenobacter oligotrophus]AYA37821.1 AraC family transcriptional regulator [Hymenobacter oligotrophus]
METFFEFRTAELTDNCQTELQQHANVVQADTLWRNPAGSTAKFTDYFLDGFQLTSMSGKLLQPLKAELEVNNPWVGMLFQFDGDTHSRSCASRPMTLGASRQNVVGDETTRNHYTFQGEQSGRDFHMFSVHLTPEFFRNLVTSNAEWLRMHERRLGRAEPFVLIPDGVAVTPMMRAIIQQIAECPYSGALKKMFLEARFLDLFVEQHEQMARSLYRLSTTERDLFYAIRDFLDAHYANPPSLLELARQFGTNDFKLKKGFKDLFGTTVFGYVAERRLAVAHQLITHTEQPLQEVAESVGFTNPAHFATAFKRKFGMAPSQMRRSRYTVPDTGAWMQLA